MINQLISQKALVNIVLLSEKVDLHLIIRNSSSSRLTTSEFAFQRSVMKVAKQEDYEEEREIQYPSPLLQIYFHTNSLPRKAKHHKKAIA